MCRFPKKRTHEPETTYCYFPKAVHDADLNVFSTSLHDFKETLDSQFDGRVSRHVVFVIFLQEFADGFR